MTRECKVCSHYYKDEINKRLIFKKQTGDTYETIAADYENIRPENLRNHYRRHMDAVGTGQTPDTDIDPEEMLGPAETEAWRTYETAMKSGDVQTALKALSAAIELLKIRRKDEAEGRAKDQEINLAESPEWISTRTKILKALEPIPGAVDALRKALGPEAEV